MDISNPILWGSVALVESVFSLSPSFRVPWLGSFSGMLCQGPEGSGRTWHLNPMGLQPSAVWSSSSEQRRRKWATYDRRGPSWETPDLTAVDQHSGNDLWWHTADSTPLP